jgi:hypothetical protein
MQEKGLQTKSVLTTSAFGRFVPARLGIFAKLLRS